MNYDPTLYLTPDELEAEAAARSAEAAKLPVGYAKQTILKEVSSLRSYADMKRWLLADTLKAPR